MRSSTVVGSSHCKSPDGARANAFIAEALGGLRYGRLKRPDKGLAGVTGSRHRRRSCGAPLTSTGHVPPRRPALRATSSRPLRTVVRTAGRDGFSRAYGMATGQSCPERPADVPAGAALQDAPDRAYAGDITSVATGEDWLYPAEFLDRYSRQRAWWCTPTAAASTPPTASRRVMLASDRHCSPRGEPHFPGNVRENARRLSHAHWGAWDCGFIMAYRIAVGGRPIRNIG